MAKTDLTAERVRFVLDYDPHSGEFSRKVTRYGNPIPPHRVGVLMGNGYQYVSIDTKLVRAHRLAWLYVTGHWPDGCIDHINGDRADNRFANLRDTTLRANAENRRCPKATATSGYMGVSKSDGRWRANIRVGGVQKHLGVFDTPEQASGAYISAKRLLHDGCTI